MGRSPVPPKWGEDTITAFFNDAEHNAFATFVHMRKEMGLLVEIDSVYRKAIDLADNCECFFQYLLIPRSHSAFLGAARLALATELPEAYMVTRGCLECALYAYYLVEHPDYIELYLKRDESPKALKDFRGKFQMTKIMEQLSQRSRHLGSAAQILYDRTIEYGAHPNEKAISSNLKITKEKGSVRFDGAYLTESALRIKLCLKTLMQTGVVGLMVAEYMLPERFKIMGLSDEIISIQRRVDAVNQ